MNRARAKNPEVHAENHRKLLIKTMHARIRMNYHLSDGTKDAIVLIMIDTVNKHSPSNRNSNFTLKGVGWSWTTLCVIRLNSFEENKNNQLKIRVNMTVPTTTVGIHGICSPIWNSKERIHIHCRRQRYRLHMTQTHMAAYVRSPMLTMIHNRENFKPCPCVPMLLRWQRDVIGREKRPSTVRRPRSYCMLICKH